MRRLEAGDATALLVDGNFNRVAAYGLLQFQDQITKLFGAFAVALEQDEAEGVETSEDRAFDGG